VSGLKHLRHPVHQKPPDLPTALEIFLEARDTTKEASEPLVLTCRTKLRWDCRSLRRERRTTAAVISAGQDRCAPARAAARDPS
jgi:hypothetical protein